MNRISSMALVLGIIFVPLIGSCAGIGAGFHAKSTLIRGEVAPAALGDRASAPADAFLTVTGRFELVAAKELPLEGGNVVLAVDGEVHSLEGAPDVIVFCPDSDCAQLQAPDGARVDGRICEDDVTFFGCRLPTGFGVYVSSEAKRRGVPPGRLRVFLAGEAPSSVRAEAWFGFGMAGFLFVTYAGLVLFVAMRKRKSAPFALELLFHVPAGPAEILAMLDRGMSGLDAFRVGRAEASRLVFVQGRTEKEASLMGMPGPEAVPRRATLEWTAQPYHPTMVRVRIEDGVTWLGEIGRLEPLCRAALARTGEQLSRALGASPVR